MERIHVVQQGEHLSRIAKQYGFTDYRTIWEHGKNAELRKKRENPNVIFPGDRLFIPERELKEEPRPTDRRHRFQVRGRSLKLRLVLQDLARKPISGVGCELRVEAEADRLVTDGQGMIQRDIPPEAEHTTLLVQTPGEVARMWPLPLPVKVGHLDPADEVSGQKGRLNNLGYFAGPLDGASEQENKELFLSAIEEFQCDHDLVVDGKCGPRTQAKLKEVHGS
jgi:Putative peptidoglycan binding domain/LysM domain